MFESEKWKAKAEKIIEKLKAKSLILKNASEKQKRKFYVMLKSKNFSNQ